MLVKSKWYPLILIGLFTLFFGLELSFWCGLLIGYLHSYGLFARIEMSATAATRLENKFPFRFFNSKLCKTILTDTL